MHDTDLPVALVALDGTLLSTTPAFAQQVGRRGEHLTGLLLEQLLLSQHESSDLLEQVRSGVQAGVVLAQSGTTVFWSALRDAAGVPVHLLVTLCGGPAHLPGRTAALLENAADATWTAQADGTILSITPSALQSYGLRPEDVVATSVFDWVVADDRTAFQAAWEAVLSGRSMHEVVECRLALPGPSATWVQQRLTDLRGDPDVRAICGNVIDISDRRLREQQRDQQERRLRAGFTQSGVPQAVLSADGRFLDANAALCRLIGRTRETLLGMHVRDITHPSDSGLADEVLTSLLSGDTETAQVEHVIAGPGGRPLHLLLDSAVLRDASGAVDAIVGHVHDLTPLRRSERRRQRQEDFFLALSMNARDLVLVSDDQGQVLYVSSALQNVVGYESHEVVGTLGFGFVHPEDAVRVRGLHEEVVAQGGTRTYDVRIRAADGSWRWFEATATNVTETAVGGIVTNLRDITERVFLEAELERVQQRYRRVFEGTSLGLMIITVEGEIVEVNAALCRLLGHERADLLGSNATALVAGPTLTVQERQSRVAARGAEGYEIEELLVRSDGTVVPVLMTVNLLQSPGDAREQISLVIRDQSRINELQAQLLRSERLEAAGRVAAGVVHDTNNILAAVSGYAEILAQEVAGHASAQRHVAGIRRSVARANDMVTQLLAFSRGQHLAAAEVDLREVVLDLDDMLRRLMPDEVHLVVDAQSAPTIADASQVRRVVLNLVVNARDAVSAGGTVRLTTALCDLEDTLLGTGRYAVLTVADDGAGMEEAIARKCFEPFFSTRVPQGGTGLGLSTAHGIAQQSGGDLRVTSAVGEGTEFTLLLPAGGGGSVPSPGLHVLVADDNPDFRSVLVEALRRDGYRVTAAHDGQDALASGVLPDLLVTDLEMPRLDGLALTDALRERREGLPVLFVSGRGSAPPVPGTRFLRKPFPLSTLRETVAALLSEQVDPALRPQSAVAVRPTPGRALHGPGLDPPPAGRTP